MFCFVLRFALWPLFIALAFGTFQFGTLIEGSNPFKKMLFILVLYSKIYVAWLASINFSASYRGSTNLLNDRETQSTLFALHCTCGWDNLISLVTSPFGCHGSIVKLFLQVFFGPCVLFIAYLKVPSFIENGYSLQIIKQWVSDQLHGLCIGWKFVQKLPLRFLPSALIPGGTTSPPLPSCHPFSRPPFPACLWSALLLHQSSTQSSPTCEDHNNPTWEDHLHLHCSFQLSTWETRQRRQAMVLHHQGHHQLSRAIRGRAHIT